MRILITTGLYPPEIGGPATYTKLVEKQLIKEGHRVSVLPFSSVRKYPTVIRHLVFLYKVLKIGRTQDIIYTQDTVSVGLPTAFGSWLLSKRFFVRVPGDFAWEQGVQRFGVKESIDDFQKKSYGFRVELLRRIQKFVVNRAERVITPSSYFKDLVSGWVKDAGKVQHIYNGIEVSHNITPHVFSKKTLVASGRLVPWKGFDSLISFVATTDFDLIIFGDGEDRARLEALIKEKNVEDRVSLPGRVSREELLAYSAGSYAVIAPSSFESFSFQLVEAMSVGAVCVAFQIGNLNEIITNGVSGYLVPAGDYEAIRKVLENLPDVRSIISENAIRESHRFSVEKTTKELLDCFRIFDRVLMISTDRNIFNEESSVWKRIQGYGTLFDALDIIVYTKRGFVKKKIGNITLYPTNVWSKWLYVPRAILMAFSQKRPRVVTTQDPFETGVVGFFLSFITTRWNVQIHTDWKSGEFQKGVLNIFRTVLGDLIMRRASSVRVVSERIRKSLPDYTKNKKVTVLPIGIHEHYEQHIVEEKENYTLVTVSRLESEKNIDVLIRAMKNISKAKLRIVGSGSCEDSLRNLVRELGIEERIIFVGYSNNVNEEYEKADMYIQASSYEGFGMSLLEAGLHGLPILTTNVGLVGYELPQDSVVIFDRNNIEDLSQKISHVLEDIQQRRELGDRVYEASQKLVTSFPEYLSMYRSSL